MRELAALAQALRPRSPQPGADDHGTKVGAHAVLAEGGELDHQVEALGNPLSELREHVFAS